MEGWLKAVAVLMGLALFLGLALVMVGTVLVFFAVGGVFVALAWVGMHLFTARMLWKSGGRFETPTGTMIIPPARVKLMAALHAGYGVGGAVTGCVPLLMLWAPREWIPWAIGAGFVLVMPYLLLADRVRKGATPVHVEPKD